MILRGVKEATFVNKVVTVAKIVPLIVAVPPPFLLQLFAVLGEFLRRRRNAGKDPRRAGARHEADHRVGLHRHRGRERRSPLRQERSDVGAATISASSRHRPDGRYHSVSLRDGAARGDRRRADLSLAGALELVVGTGARCSSPSACWSLCLGLFCWNLILVRWRCWVALGNHWQTKVGAVVWGWRSH